MNRRTPHRRRWEVLPVEERRDSFAHARALIEEHQAAKSTANQRQATWTAEENTVLIARQDEPVRVLATDLGRTLHWVRQ